MLTRIATLILAAALALAAASCGSSSDDSGSSPNVDGSKQVAALNTSEQTSMCDWYADLVGGYGSTPSCAMAAITAPDSLAVCLADFPNCAVTVATFEICVNDLVSAQETCTQQAISTASLSSACQMVGQAGCFQ